MSTSQIGKGVGHLMPKTDSVSECVSRASLGLTGSREILAGSQMRIYNIRNKRFYISKVRTKNNQLTKLGIKARYVKRLLTIAALPTGWRSATVVQMTAHTAIAAFHG